MLSVFLNVLCQTTFFVNINNLKKIIVQLSQYYHCDIMNLYNTPIVQIYELVEIINDGVK